MPEVWIRSDDAARGSVPARCAKTGTRCITRFPLRAQHLPAPLEWSTWTGLWPRGAPAEAPSAVLSLLPGVRQVHLWLARSRDISTAGIGGLLLLALVSGGMVRQVALTAVLLLAIVKAAVALVGIWWAVDVRADVSGEWLLLSNVHPTFVEAVESGLTRPATAPVLPDQVEQHAPAPGAAGQRTGAATTDST